MNDKASERKNEIKGRYRKSLLVQFSIVVVFICFLWFSSKQDKPVQIEHKLIPNETRRSLKQIPTIDNLLFKKELLRLSEKQIEQLNKLKLKQDKKLDPIDKQLKLAVDDFNTFMNDSGKNGTNFSEIVSHSAPATDLGKRRRIIMESFSREGMKLLDAEQSKLASQEYMKSVSKFKPANEIGEVDDKQ